MNFDVSGCLARPIVLTALALAAVSVMAQEPVKALPDAAASARPLGIHWKNDPQSLAEHPSSVAGQRAAAEAAQ